MPVLTSGQSTQQARGHSQPEHTARQSTQQARAHSMPKHTSGQITQHARAHSKPEHTAVIRSCSPSIRKHQPALQRKHQRSLSISSNHSRDETSLECSPLRHRWYDPLDDGTSLCARNRQWRSHDSCHRPPPRARLSLTLFSSSSDC